MQNRLGSTVEIGIWEILIPPAVRCIQVNAEDTDWLVYHRLPENGSVAESELAEGLGLDGATIAESLARLERSCLVERRDGSVRMLNFGEALLRNQCRYEQDLPYVIENGVIKARRS
jgi:hypothetical protein